MSTTARITTLFVGLGSLVCLVSVSEAATVRPVAVPVFTGFNNSYGNSPGELINGHNPPGSVAGFVGAPTVGDDAVQLHTNSGGGGNFGQAFYTGGGTGKELIFDLGGWGSLDSATSIYFWNGNQNSQLDRQITNMDVQVSGAATLAAAQTDFAGPATTLNVSVPTYGVIQPNPALPLSLAGLGPELNSVRYVRFSEFIENGEPVGVISEVRFNGTGFPTPPITITPANHARVFIGGGGDQSWINFDDGRTVDAARQQWVWMDLGTSWTSLIPANEIVVSAELTFSDAVFQGGSQPSNYSIFEVPGSDLGRAGIIAFNGPGRDGDELPDYYAGNTAYGLVTAADINAAAPVTFDITSLIQGWLDGSLTTNVGQMMILNDADMLNDSANFAWTNWNSAGPTILLTTQVIPEPSTFLIWALLAGLGLAAYARRKRTK